MNAKKFNSELYITKNAKQFNEVVAKAVDALETKKAKYKKMLEAKKFDKIERLCDEIYDLESVINKAPSSYKEMAADRKATQSYTWQLIKQNID